MTESPVDPSEREFQLAAALNELTERGLRGEAIDFEEVAREYPDFAEELRSLLGAAFLADAVGLNASSLSPAGSKAQGIFAAVPSFDLPAEFGDYVLLEEIGRGGMGIVYRARQKSLNREVALKMLLRGTLASAADVNRFRAEAEAAARLDHPHIVPVYEVGEHEGHLFFSMKYVHGQTLGQIAANGPIDPRQATTYVAQAARAIAAAHEQGILHRDVKPSNILVDDDGVLHVTDFGLAKRLTDSVSLTRTGAVLGTPAYMAPEQAAGNRGIVGPASDVYSLGTVLYQLLTGRPPFQAASPVDLVLLVLEQDPLPPRMINPTVDRDLEMITLRCLQKPPDLRYATAADLATDLEAYLHDEPLSVRSFRLGQVVSRLFRETHHAEVLENWGLLWMWHSAVLLVVCCLTQWLDWSDNRNRLHYFLVWTAGLGTWAAVFWAVRRRMGPVTFVERQIAHVWAASMIGIGLLFPIEAILDFDVLSLTPMLAVTSGMVFFIKAGILSGSFYWQAAALFATAFVIARFPAYGHLIFGVVAALCFFIPGWKYYHQRRRTEQRRLDALPP